MKYVLGLDFGTDSIRALVTDAYSGRELTTGMAWYPRWKKGLYCDPGETCFRQHPADHIEAMQLAVREAIAPLCPEDIACIEGIGVDSTGSTPVAVNRNGLPLALLPDFEQDPDAMFILWKDHTALREAEEINELAHQWDIDYTACCGGMYSPEWFWSKILHVLRKNVSLRREAFSWLEHCDWVPAMLTGNNDPLLMKRSRCAAGHKAMWSEDFGGLPSEKFLVTLDPLLNGLRDRLYSTTSEVGAPAGKLCDEWAVRLGLPSGITVATGSLDAHVGAVGAGIEPFTLVKVTGTSTCDMIVVPSALHSNGPVKGICGQVNGSILPGMYGLEAGQSAFGDVYKWFEALISFALNGVTEGVISADQAAAVREKVLPALNEAALRLPLTESDPVALDWVNGRRTPDVNLSLKAAITGLHFGSGAAEVFKALVEATAFGARAIAERFEEQGVLIHKVVAIGGISKKSPFVMQTLANVMNRTIQVPQSEQACALGACMLAATACGIWPSLAEAQQYMKAAVEKEYLPEEHKVIIYNKLFDRYIALGEFAETSGLVS